MEDKNSIDTSNNDKKEDDKDLSIEIDNLNINQEVDIKENPKKHLVNTKKKQILQNNIDNENIINIKEKKINITFDDIYLGNEMFLSAPKSYPRDNNSNSNRDSNNCENNSSNHNNSSTNNISNYSLAEEEEYDDDEVGIFRNNSYNNFFDKKESSHLRDFLSSINNYRISTNIFSEEENIFVDEDEKKDVNIFYIENEKELTELSYYSKKNKCNISFITLNLFIKEICIGSLRTKYPILYKSFESQYQEFLSVSSLIEKILDSMNFYIKKIGIEIPDLVFLLNKIISTQFKKIEDNKE